MKSNHTGVYYQELQANLDWQSVTYFLNTDIADSHALSHVNTQKTP